MESLIRIQSDYRCAYLWKLNLLGEHLHLDLLKVLKGCLLWKHSVFADVIVVGKMKLELTVMVAMWVITVLMETARL